jgi:hypothetical protein
VTDRIDMASYSAEYASQYASRAFETVLVRIRQEQVLDAMARYPHARILEVGCGLDPLFTRVPQCESFTVVEPSSEFAQHARALAAGRADVHVVAAFLEDVVSELAALAPDFIAVSSLLHEVRDVHGLLAALRTIATPRTVLHFNVPNVRSFHRLLAAEMGLIQDVFEPSPMERRFQRQRRFDARTLADLLEAEGFRVCRAGSYFIKPFTHAQMQAMLEGGIIDDRVVRGLQAMSRHFPDLGCEIFADAIRHG